MDDSMKLTCIVDNHVALHSRLRGEHGLSFLIESPHGAVLFDSGASGDVLLHNLDVSGLDPSIITAMALSHAHRDHSGGLPALLAQHPSLPLYAHSDIFRERFSQHGPVLAQVGLPLSKDSLAAQTALHLATTPQEILPGIWSSGEIEPRPEAEGRSPHHFVRQGRSLIPDPYRDDMALLVETSAGLALICGCCHAGLLNTLFHVERTFDKPVVAVIGGTHLAEADPQYLQRVGQTLRERRSLRHVYLNHCSGELALYSLTSQLGPQTVHPCPAGTQIDLEVF